MNFIALHRSADTSLTTRQWLLDPSEATTCESAVDLLERLQALYASARKEINAAVAQAREEGHADGQEEALRTAAPRLLAAWQQASRQAQADMHALREAVVTLSRHVVQRIADTLAPADVVTALALRAMQELVPPRAAVVRVHPDVAAAVQAHLADQGGTLDANALEVRADPGLDVFDCILDTPAGQLLASLDTQLDNMAQALRACPAECG